MNYRRVVFFWESLVYAFRIGVQVFRTIRREGLATLDLGITEGERDVRINEKLKELFTACIARNDEWKHDHETRKINGRWVRRRVAD